MRCPTCGTGNPGHAKFCLECGAKLSVSLPPVVVPDRRGELISPLPPPREPASTGVATDAGAAAAAAALKRLAPREYAERLLAAGGQTSAERRLVTILFSDVKGSTALAEHLDPEDVMEIMNGAFEHLIAPVYRHEGTLARLMGDAILAFFGAPICHEDDPERAIRAALEIQAGIQSYAARLTHERGIADFNVRVGINTGLVVVGEIGSDLRVEYTAMGDAINLAARMEQNAPPGGILITHGTYRLVREVFDVQPQPPLSVKGHAEPVRTYLVLRARPRAFRSASRGVEGVEVRMIGRDAELAQLQTIFQAVAEASQPQVVTLVGDAGVGKSRLLHEFERGLERCPASLDTLKGRATAMAQFAPFGLLRDLFARRFTVLESDSAAVVRDKLESGITAVLRTDSAGPMKAHFVGHLLGFDFSDSPHLRGALGDPRQLHDRARGYLADFFREAATFAPVVVFLEDLHWADDSSLDAINYLALTLVGCPLLFVCAVRPVLLERRPDWGDGRSGHTRLDLGPLSLQASRRLVGEILQKVETVPVAFRDLIVTGAEGNPFFAEELIKMLIEDGVIVKGAGGQDRWQVDPDRFATTHVPDTLTGVLQARLDRLTPHERSVLQQASVVGRQFWDQAVAQIGRAEGARESVPAALAVLRTKEMVFQRETSAFAEAQEYIFKHALLREVAYESLLKRLRRVYHGLVADWLIERTGERGGERAGEIAGLIGEHLELAGRAVEAAGYLGRAAVDAAAKFANEEAIRYYRRALGLYEDAASGVGQDHGQQESLVSLYEGLGDVYELLSQKSEARAAYAGALAATPDGDRICRARLQRKLANVIPMQQVDEHLKGLAVAEGELGPPAAEADHAWWREWLEIQLGRMASYYWGRRFEAIEQAASQVRPVLETHGSLVQRADFQRGLANASITRARFVTADESLAHVRLALSCDLEAGNLRTIATDRYMLGFHLLWHGELSEAESELRGGLDLAEQVGDAGAQTIALTYLTICYRFRNEIDQARAHAARSLDTAAKAKLDLYIAMARGNLAWLAWRDGDFAAAEALAQAAWSTLRVIPGPFRWVVLWPLIAMAAVREQFALAADLARQMLHPSQQRLPEALAALLQAAIRAQDNDEPEAGRTQLQRAVAFAQQMGYL